MLIFIFWFSTIAKWAETRRIRMRWKAIMQGSKSLNQAKRFILDAISSLIDHQPKKTHFVELFYYFHFSFDIDYSFYVVSETNVLLWSRSPKPKWYVKLFSSLNFKWLTTTHRCALLKFYKMLFLFVFFLHMNKNIVSIPNKTQNNFMLFISIPFSLSPVAHWTQRTNA